MSATRSLFERRDVIVVASVSCIYGIGSPEAYFGMMLMLEKGQSIAREAILRKLVEIQYDRAEDLRRGTFRVRGDIIEIYPPYDDFAVRIELWGSQIEAIRKIDPLTGEIRSREGEISRIPIYPKVALRPARRATRARHPGHLRRARMVEAGASSAREKSSRRSASRSAPSSTSK